LFSQRDLTGNLAGSRRSRRDGLYAALFGCLSVVVVVADVVVVDLLLLLQLLLLLVLDVARRQTHLDHYLCRTQDSFIPRPKSQSLFLSFNINWPPSLLKFELNCKLCEPPIPRQKPRPVEDGNLTPKQQAWIKDPINILFSSSLEKEN
jgi:hypothetical protein